MGLNYKRFLFRKMQHRLTPNCVSLSHYAIMGATNGLYTPRKKISFTEKKESSRDF